MLSAESQYCAYVLEVLGVKIHVRHDCWIKGGEHRDLVLKDLPLLQHREIEEGILKVFVSNLTDVVYIIEETIVRCSFS